MADRVLAGDDSLKKSEKQYDWLGSGIYFWEHGPERAMDWAREQKQLRRLKTPAVVGAVIHLGICFDFMDIHSTKTLSKAFPTYKKFQQRYGLTIPRNEKRNASDKDALRRKLDCSMINWLCDVMAEEQEKPYDSVRGMFQEDDPAFEGSSIRLKSHIQLSIRNTACILGYFRPV